MNRDDATHFPNILLSQWQLDLLRQVDGSTLEKMLMYARARSSLRF